MSKQSLLALLGLPDQFGVALLLLALALFLAPYLAGHDFGVVKIPSFNPAARRILRFIGPVCLLAVVLLHVPLVDKPTPPQKEGHTVAEATCTLSGLVFDSDTNRPLAGVFLDLYRDLSNMQQRPTVLKPGVATTGPDGKFSINCNWVKQSQFPILLALRNPNWQATRITGPKIEKPGQWEGINIPIAMSEVELKPLPDVWVSFSDRKIGPDWFLVGIVENKGGRTFACVRARFHISTSYQDKMEGEPDRDLGFVDVDVRDLGPNEKRPYQTKLPKKVGIGLISKQECQ
ncbi:hypothetical protein [Paraburkholderia hospita]|uniref:hypothetical protein n=1 Tax=Paraburkholderia hospita TaxID=169430 RepID=UPI003ECC9BF8